MPVSGSLRSNLCSGGEAVGVTSNQPVELPTGVLASAPAPQQWESPGPGTWLLDASHAPRPLCRFSAAVFPPPLMAGFHDTFARYGSLLECLDVAVVGGFFYERLRAVGAPPEAVGPPPEPVFRKLLQEDPALRARVATAEAVYIERRGRGDLRLWGEAGKAALLGVHPALTAVDLRTGEGAGVCDHVGRGAEALAEGPGAP